METVTLIMLYMPTGKGPRLQKEIYARSVMMDSGGHQIRYRTLEDRPASLIISGTLFVVMESCEGGWTNDD